MVILGIDPGLINTGYGLIKISGKNNLEAVDFGIISPDKKEKLSNRLKTISKYFSLSDSLSSSPGAIGIRIKHASFPLGAMLGSEIEGKFP